MKVQRAVSACVVVAAVLAQTYDSIGQEVLTLEITSAPKIVTFEPLMMRFRVTNHSDRDVLMQSGARQYLELQQRPLGTRGEWKAIWRPEASLSTFQGISEPRLLSVVPPKGDQLFYFWVFWRPPLECEGQPFVFHRPENVEVRAVLSISPFIHRDPNVRIASLTIISNSLPLTVESPSPDDEKALNVITHRNLISMENYDNYIPANLATSRPKSSLADLLNYYAALHELRQLPRHHVDDNQGKRNAWLSGRNATDFVLKISDRNHLLRELGAVYILMRHSGTPHGNNGLNLEAIRPILANAEVAAAYLVKTPDARRKLVRHFHQQEVRCDDDRLEVEYTLQELDDDTIGRILKRIAETSGVPLDISNLPIDIRERQPSRFVQIAPRTLRALLDAKTPEDWYWVSDGDGYALVYKEPTFAALREADVVE